ncbi:MAG: hypothetical protein IJ615_03605 [Bacteroidaceae bacterium]|nr:hypothetical protein [Bacteroidaceae bacterium]
MKKTYSTPETLVVKIGLRSHLMDVSYQGDNLNSMSLDVNEVGGSQLVKDNKSIWDNEW